jgi:hypothetical protein
LASLDSSLVMAESTKSCSEYLLPRKRNINRKTSGYLSVNISFDDSYRIKQLCDWTAKYASTSFDAHLADMVKFHGDIDTTDFS